MQKPLRKMAATNQQFNKTQNKMSATFSSRTNCMLKTSQGPKKLKTNHNWYRKKKNIPINS
tara:strand:+ start:102 stop:284 length:183 start_codon:yes stop_codon:yes gene_type:complete